MALAAAMALAAGSSLASEHGGEAAAPPHSSGPMVLIPQGGDDIGGEVVVNVYRFQYPGMPEKRGCRIRLVVDNHTPETIGFYGKFRTGDKGVEQDVWFTSTAGVRPKQSAERLYSCSGHADTVVLDQDSMLGYPAVCDVGREQVSPCRFRLRLESNISFGDPASVKPPAPAAGGGGGGHH